MNYLEIRGFNPNIYEVAEVIIPREMVNATIQPYNKIGKMYPIIYNKEREAYFLLHENHGGKYLTPEIYIFYYLEIEKVFKDIDIYLRYDRMKVMSYNSDTGAIMCEGEYYVNLL